MTVYDYFKPITTFILDMDGVLTNGTVLVTPDGEMLRNMNIKDGYALQLAVKKKYRVVILSGGHSQAVIDRLRNLGVFEVFMKVADKKFSLDKYVHGNNLQPEEVIFMGDDIPDLEAMKTVGVGCCPADAVEEIKEVCKYISPLKGGEGCVRDVIEKVLKLQGKWNHDEGVSSR